MSKVVVVVGSGYGDEGKGLMTDYYSSKMDGATVIRFNGGAQAGHTVVTPDGKRHVFSHFGSGTFNGARTYLSDYFVANPFMFKKELKELQQITDMKIDISAHPGVLISTPYDMLINQKLEVDRAKMLHGSVGVGFGETIERSWVHSSLYMDDLGVFTDTDLIEFLDKIRKEYVPTRVNLREASPTFMRILRNDCLLHDTVAAMRVMQNEIWIDNYHMLTDGRPLIFEGAQGLQLDQDYGYFPHVTRSNCGMRNVREILEELGRISDFDITVNYVTRAYQTRHGAGPLAHEGDVQVTLPENETNVLNQWQGQFRLAPFNDDAFAMITAKDFALYAPRGAKRVNTMTCLDQLDEEVSVIEHGKVQQFSRDSFRRWIVPLGFQFKGYGPTRNDVRRVEV